LNDKNPSDPGGELLWLGRIVPDGREGNVVFARSLRPGEVDTGEGVRVGEGEQLVIRAGGLSVNSDEIDAESPKGMGGYAPVANTIWTWHQFAREQLGYFLFIFSFARRLDAAHRNWSESMKDREHATSMSGIPRRAALFSALATAEITIIALHRATIMAETLVHKHCTDLVLPDEIELIAEAVTEMRLAFEHIDDRAEGKVGQNRRFDIEALTIFDQPDFITSAILRYKQLSLNFETDVLAALLACRRLIIDSIDSRIGAQVEREHGTEA